MDLNIKWGHVACLDVGFNGQGNQILVYNCDLTTWRSLYGLNINYKLTSEDVILVSEPRHEAYQDVRFLGQESQIWT